MAPKQREQNELAVHWRLPKASFSGAFDSLPCALISRNAGDSCSCRRMYTEIPSSTIETRKGTRQPYSLNAIPQRQPAHEDHEQREEQPQRRGRLDPARVEPRLPSGACSAT